MADKQTERSGASAYGDPADPRTIISRSKFLTGATVGLGGLIGVAIAVPVVGFVLGPAFATEDWYWASFGPADNKDFKAGTYEPVIFERGKLGELDRRVAYVRRDGAEEFTIISNVCMHLGCPVQFKTTNFACPCHGGQYDTEGIVTAGPPVRPLNRFEYKVEGGTLYVGRPFATQDVDGKVVMTDTFKLPGAPVGGLLGWLYPSPA
ncbi:MAG: ubiquinol-cytochrome c reductase iron-sulfur subunit [Thermoleophilia bacterium]|nr:ubiquinol-cytochrome c reductase iron-sulfur subunit [Thermoleophilia bacterium]MBJ7333352.1 ubiquinol-cytochrome c reductase iron-sulfur subunit [Thermoleophilia bacterium]